ncbi:ClpXP adapter SpxH family protein [Oceanobacillus jeddahense]|uniref:ClpXP adapter protein SpxH n=1 Tax=Oceanobacillus jeddahense TaxID=1462527 RepID=A0ABY5JNA2_9BACI|nr:ClpXP adapter SpxH family protein [Oceanobacillus jeddahense]UUI01791.1 DsbA family protein [Oceanobacillus jeddahense]
MNGNQQELSSSNQIDSSFNYMKYVQKPIEMYVFIDPLCSECWALEPYLKKLYVEYGRFFTIKHVISGQLAALNPNGVNKSKQRKKAGSTCFPTNYEDLDYPWVPALAIKAAELQGKKAGKHFIRKIQETLFFDKQNICNEDILLDCASEAALDVEEFQKDLFSDTSKRALQCDLRLACEMDVDYTPTIVLFNQQVEDEGVKLSGLHPYDIYEFVLKEILQRTPIPSVKPPLIDYLQLQQTVGTKELSVIYDWSIDRTEKELKKLQFQQIVERVPEKNESYWRYLGTI